MITSLSARRMASLLAALAAVLLAPAGFAQAPAPASAAGAAERAEAGEPREPRATTSPQTEAGEPRADTSGAGAAEPGMAPPAAPAGAAGAAGNKSAEGTPRDGKAREGKGAEGKGAEGKAADGRAKPGAVDRLNLNTATVTGDREQPKVMYIVPWKRSDIGDLSGKPMNSLLEEALAPVDRDEFKREVIYYNVVKSDASQNGAPAPAAKGEK